MKSVIFKIISEIPNKRCVLNNYIGKELDGRIFNSGNTQVKLPRYTNWFDVPINCVCIVNN